jgi:magnesium chelatase family protein
MVKAGIAPADLPKEGSHYDLPIALGLMAAVGAVARRNQKLLRIRRACA